VCGAPLTQRRDAFLVVPLVQPFRMTFETLLPAVAPFSLDASVHAMSSFRPCCGDQVVLGDRVRRALVRPDKPDEAVVVEVAPRPEAAVLLRVYPGSPLPADAAAHVSLSVRRWLGLDDDLRPFLDLAAADPPVAALLGEVVGLHQVRFGSLAEGATYFALTQRSTQWFATSRKARIAADLGPRSTVDGVEYVAFPPLETLTGLGAEGLLPYAGNRQRAGRLAEILDGVATLDEEWLRAAPYDEARKALLDLRGVGPFTANAILLRVLGRPDDVPLEMAQFGSVIDEVYGAAAPSPAELRAHYAPYVGWWAYLCRMALGRRAANQSNDASQRSSVRTPQPVAPLVSSASALSDHAGADMST
jgi:DNA-3-methyladenine glycosylase II